MTPLRPPKSPPDCVTIGGWVPDPGEIIKPGWTLPAGQQDYRGLPTRKDGKPSVRSRFDGYCYYRGTWCPVGTAAVIKAKGRWAVTCLGPMA